MAKKKNAAPPPIPPRVPGKSGPKNKWVAAQAKFLAQRLYTTRFCTINDVARETGVGKSTISKWRADGNWDDIRNRMLNLSGSVHESLLRLVLMLSNEALDVGIKNDGIIPPSSEGRLKLLGRLVPILEKALRFDDEMLLRRAKSESAAKSAQLSDEDVKALVSAKIRDILGIREARGDEEE